MNDHQKYEKLFMEFIEKKRREFKKATDNLHKEWYRLSLLKPIRRREKIKNILSNES